MVPLGIVFSNSATEGEVEIFYEQSSGSWGLNDLTAATNAPAAAGDPDGFVFAAQERMDVVYRGADSHIRELYWGSA